MGFEKIGVHDYINTKLGSWVYSAEVSHSFKDLDRGRNTPDTDRNRCACRFVGTAPLICGSVSSGLRGDSGPKRRSSHIHILDLSFDGGTENVTK